MLATGDTRESRWPAYARLLRLDRPIGILLLLWPTLWALWLAAGGLPPIGILAIFVAGVVLTRSAGCVINDYADRWLDPDVERTRDRPLASGEVSGREALIIFVVLMLTALGLVFLTNRLTIWLAVVAAVLAVSYPYMKRHIWFPQVVLGAAFSMSIPMAYTALEVEIGPITILLFCANLLWTTAYDTLYAMVDREDDIKAGARSTATQQPGSPPEPTPVMTPWSARASPRRCSISAWPALRIAGSTSRRSRARCSSTTTWALTACSTR